MPRRDRLSRRRPRTARAPERRLPPLQLQESFSRLPRRPDKTAPVRDGASRTTSSTAPSSSRRSRPARTRRTRPSCSARASSRRRPSSAGSRVKPWVKTSLAPGLEGRHRVPAGRGAPAVPRGARASTSSATAARPASATRVRSPTPSPRRCATSDLVVAAVLSGNRNFEGRINPQVAMNFLASPPLVVAYALAGDVDIDLTTRAARHGPERRARLPEGHLADAGGGRRRGRERP